VERLTIDRVAVNPCENHFPSFFSHFPSLLSHFAAIGHPLQLLPPLHFDSGTLDSVFSTPANSSFEATAANSGQDLAWVL
jgi:hypothetical protein